MIKSKFALNPTIKQKHTAYFQKEVLEKIDIILKDRYGFFHWLLDDDYFDFLEKIKADKKYNFLFDESDDLKTTIADYDINYDKAFFDKKLKKTNISKTSAPFINKNGKINEQELRTTATFHWFKNDLLKVYDVSQNTEINNYLNDVLFLSNYATEYILLFFVVVKTTDYGKLTLRLFNYSSFRRARKGWCGPELINCHGLRCCPYCGRNYITSWRSCKTEEATAQLDHYYPKERYPYLSLSLYNLIPSCAVCNKYKSSSKEEIINPLTVANTDVTFSLWSKKKKRKFITASEALSDTKDIQIKFDYTGSSIKLENTLKAFHLEEIYETHIIEIEKFLIKIRKANSPYYYKNLIELYKVYPGSSLASNTIGFNYDFFIEVFGYDPNELPLNKLFRDIYHQFR